MLWKILSFFSAACLGAACYFAWSNQKDLDQERSRSGYAKANLKAAQTRKKEGDEGLIAKKAVLETSTKDLQTAKDETVKLAAEAVEKEAALTVIKGNLEQISQQVTTVQKQIDEAGDIEKLIAQIEKVKKEKLEAEGAAANQTQRIASAKAEFENVVAQTTKLRETEARGRKGVVDPEFTARISQYFPQWGFGILNKGNTGGVFANADLEVKRGKNVIAKLKVKNVEQNGAIAELIPGSLAEGEVIQTGDSVVAAQTQSTDSKGNAPAAGTTPTGSQPAAPDATAPAAPAAPAMGSDPFGAAPAAPAPAMGSDPFGAAPAPAAPAPAAPAMGADPFGAAPAPAAPGTPATPSTADPFGAAPAAKP
jgi:hypothetical protein